MLESDRFAEVEGLSGSSSNDILIGDDQTAAIIANITARGSVLTNISLIDGLQGLLDHAFEINPASGTHVTSFGTGNIILGGDGSDLITGNDGDDVIDGDAWLNVRISVRANKDGTGPEIASYDSMQPLVPLMRDGVYNPGQLVAVREILPGHGGFDTAQFNGPLSNYTVVVDDRGTPLDFSDDVVRVTDISAKPLDGSDRLTHIERLQFADQAVVLVPGLNAEPVGQLTILDGVTSAPDDTPTEGQLLKVSIAGVTDADNAGGAVTNATYVWQVELNAGTGVFSDIILKPGRIGVGFPSADGATFTVDPALGLSGLRLRVRAVYEDDHGVTEQAFSAPTAPVIAVPVAPPTLPTFVDHTQESAGVGVHFIRSDLDFILDQIHIAERHAAGEDLVTLLPNVRVPFGLRTVDGSFNNLIDFDVPDQTKFGAADTVFPRLTDPVFRPADPVSVDLDGPGPLTVGTPTSYAQTSGFVFDSQPRTISNLIVDQTASNPAAYANAYDPGPDGILNFGAPGNDDVLKDGVQIVKSPGLDGKFDTADDRDVFFFANTAPDAGVSAPFDAWFTFFGQFFDHGLDLVTKGGNGTIFIPLQPDDPLIAGADGLFGTQDDLPPELRFMVETRATMLPGPDGKLGTADDVHDNSNTTTPFVDQNQTYSSHPSHQVFLRAYAIDPADGQPHATGKLLENRDLGPDGHFGTADDIPIGGMSTWAVVKAQARDILGINLTDADVSNVPLLATDPYGNYIRGPHGLPQVVMQTAGADGIFGTADDGTVLVEGNPASPIDLTHAMRTGHQFLIDINATANPFDPIDGHMLSPDTDGAIGLSNGVDAGGNPVSTAGFYDDELLDAHYIAGDGRVNENIGLTAVHAIFHSEHNRLVDQVKQTILIAEGDTPGYINDWVMPGFVYTPGMTADQIDWNGERLFQVAKFGTEMQYQHLVFEEFARTVQPLVDPFFAPTQVYDTKINPAIVAEFAHTVYRFGHSMLTETVDRFDSNFNVVGDPNSADPDQQLGLIAAFLNPLAYAGSGPTPADATGAIVRGVTRTVGNEIDEFVTEALRNNLLGTPLDLAVLNLARGRDTGIPSLNGARAQFYADISDPELKPYTSWADFVQHLKHPESLINFIAAYGTHESITAATTTADKRAAALLLVLGDGNDADGVTINGATYFDRLDFLNSTGSWANASAVHTAKDFDGVTTTGLGSVDFWIGGLAEEITPFGGMLGSTFNFVFENQMEKLQDADRFYYLERTAGMNFNAELEANSFAKLIEANTDATHLPALVFKAADFTLEVDSSKQFNEHTGVFLPGPDGILGTADDVENTRADPVNTGPFSTLIPLVIRDNPDTVGPDTNYLQFTGDKHVVLGGTAANDILISGSGDDTIYGDDGNDRIEGGADNDHLLGGAGDDIITDRGGDDVIEGQDGNDVIQGGGGANILLGGFGQDFIISGEDASEIFGGPGNDFLYGSKANEFSFGNEGDDWIEKGTSDGAAGDNFDPFGNEPVKGNDVFLGDGGPDNVDGEGGDDIYIATPSEADRFIGFGGFDWATFKNDPVGVTVGLDSSLRFFDQPKVPGSPSSIISRLDLVEGLSGSHHDDFLFGDDADATTIAGAGIPPFGSILLNPGLINGLQDFLNDFLGTPTTPVVTSFDAGNIILGGEGSDFIMGQGGNDLIDGDAWLNVRISVRSLADPNIELTSADSMVDLMPAMLSGAYSPGQLQIVRELLYSPTPDFDTAVFASPLANYTFTVNGVAVDAAGLAAATVAAGPDAIVTVTDNSATGGVKLEGTDSLRHIERLQFSDQAIVLGGLNHQPVGALILDGTPTEDRPVSVVFKADGSLAGVTDADNPNGAITGPISYFWQGELTPGAGNFQDIMFFGAGETQRAVGPTFTPTEPFVGGINFVSLVGVAIRVRAVYQDAHGVLEEVFSAPQVVLNANDAPTAGPTVSDTTPTEGLAIFADPTTIVDPDGTTTAVAGSLFSFQWQQANAVGVGGGASGFSDIAGATTQLFVPAQAQVNRELRVVVTYVDDHGTTEIVPSAVTTVVGNHIVGSNAANTFNGTTTPEATTEGQDIIFGQGGNDNISSLGEADIIDGGTGNDTINAGAGNDTINYTMGQGADTVDGGADTDTLNITGGLSATGNDTLDVVFNGTALTSVEGGAVTNVERVIADLQNGINSLNYGATSVPVTVNLATGEASGFLSIANIQNVTGGASNDTLTGNELNNTINGSGGDDVINGGLGNDTLSGGAGNDTFVASVGDGDDAYNGGAGVDTYDLSGTNAGASITTTSASSLETGNDTLAGFENYTGSQGNDVIAVNGGVNVIDGQGGDDTISAGGGTDTVSGGAGNDTITGGTGNDTLNGGAGLDTFLYTFGDGADTIDGGADSDTLRITGTAGANTLNVLFNGTALTTFEGGTLANVEAVTADLGAGTDTLTYAGTTANVSVNLTTGAASGFGGAGSLAGIENVTGGAGNDTLTGTAGANTLTGGGGNDVLDGAGGADALAGGAGDDTYITDGGDTLTEGAGAGTDTVVSSATFTLANNFENLTLTGAGNINGTGNGAANTITGNDGNNVLTGGGGNDTLNGGIGADTLVGGTGLDVLTGGAGNDTFDFNALGESGVGVGANDLITDFTGAGVVGGDVIDLSGIDAVNGGADQAFVFIGNDVAFTAAGQLRAVHLGGDTFIQANTNANTGTIEFELRLNGNHILNAQDFVL